MKTIIHFLCAGIAVAILALGAGGESVTGNWDLSVKMERGYSGQPKVVLKQNGRKLEGTYSGPLGNSPISGTIDGQKVSFTVNTMGPQGPVQSVFTGTLTAPKVMAGTLNVTRNGTASNGKWEGKRE